MPKFFVDTFNGKLEGENAQHAIKSLRIKPGEKLVIGDGNLYDYYCHVKNILGNTVELSLDEKRPNNTEPSLKVTLYQCLLKGDKLSEVIKHAVELGVDKIVPVISEHCVKLLRDNEKLTARLNRISESAAKQSFRGKIPVVEKPVNISEVPKNSIILYEASGESFKSAIESRLKETPEELGILIGSEGGFSAKEAAMFKYKVHLGNRILRAETAPLAALAIIMHLTGNLEDSYAF